MPKVTDTKRDRAKRLFESIKRGPASVRDDPKLAEQYDLWARTWVLQELIDLVPALREIRDEANKCKHCGKRPFILKDVDNETGVPGAWLVVCTVACKKALRYHGVSRKQAVNVWNADNPEERSELIQAIQGRRD